MTIEGNISIISTSLGAASTASAAVENDNTYTIIGLSLTVIGLVIALVFHIRADRHRKKILALKQEEARDEIRREIMKDFDD